MADTFRQAVQAWVVLDDHEASLKKQIRDLRREKEGLAATIQATMKSQKVSACTLPEDKGTLKVCTLKRKKALKPEGIRKSLEQLLAGDQQKVERGLLLINEARETVEVPKLKRIRAGGRKKKGDDQEDAEDPEDPEEGEVEEDDE